jgi:hypothetical protein
MQQLLIATEILTVRGMKGIFHKARQQVKI